MLTRLNAPRPDGLVDSLGNNLTKIVEAKGQSTKSTELWNVLGKTETTIRNPITGISPLPVGGTKVFRNVEPGGAP